MRRARVLGIELLIQTGGVVVLKKSSEGMSMLLQPVI